MEEVKAVLQGGIDGDKGRGAKGVVRGEAGRLEQMGNKTMGEL